MNHTFSLPKPAVGFSYSYSIFCKDRVFVTHDFTPDVLHWQELHVKPGGIGSHGKTVPPAWKLVLSKQVTGVSFSPLESMGRAAFKQWPAAEGDCIKNSGYTQLPCAKFSVKNVASDAWFGEAGNKHRGFSSEASTMVQQPFFVPRVLWRHQHSDGGRRW